MIQPTERLGRVSEPGGNNERIARRRVLQGAAAISGASVLTGAIPSGVVDALPSGASRYQPLTKGVRVADTRYPKDNPFTRVTDRRIRIQIGGRFGVPKTATAVVMTVAGVNWGEGNWIVCFPSRDGAPPTAANLNLVPWEVNANLVSVKLNGSGRVDLAARTPCEMVVDVLGYYEPVAGSVKGGRFVGLSTARRALDTRLTSTPTVAAGSFTVVDVTSIVPADASSVVVNLTATETAAAGWFTCVPFDQTSKPTTSSLNVSGPGATRGTAAIVPISTVGGRRRFKVYALKPAKLVLDVTGYYTSDSSASSQTGLFVPVTPSRVLDTRLPGQIGRLWPKWVVEVTLSGPAATASAIVANVTGVESRGPGFFTVTGARQPIPVAANVNWNAANAVVPNHVITPVTATHGFQVYSSHGAHAVVDLSGYFTGTPKIPKLAAYVNPPPPAAAPSWVLRVPRLGLTSWVHPGDPDGVTDAGHSWHWTGTGYMGQASNVAVFAHRTEAGGPYRNLHHMVAGDTFTVTTDDRREYTYRMVRRDMTDFRNDNILAATRAHPGTTFSMVACTKTNWLPTSLSWRIIVTGELVSWREV